MKEFKPGGASYTQNSEEETRFFDSCIRSSEHANVSPNLSLLTPKKPDQSRFIKARTTKM